VVVSEIAVRATDDMVRIVLSEVEDTWLEGKYYCALGDSRGPFAELTRLILPQTGIVLQNIVSVEVIAV
jgi:hypothetical protein